MKRTDGPIPADHFAPLTAAGVLQAAVRVDAGPGGTPLWRFMARGRSDVIEAGESPPGTLDLQLRRLETHRFLAGVLGGAVDHEAMNRELMQAHEAALARWTAGRGRAAQAPTAPTPKDTEEKT